MGASGDAERPTTWACRTGLSRLELEDDSGHEKKENPRKRRRTEQLQQSLTSLAASGWSTCGHSVTQQLIYPKLVGKYSEKLSEPGHLSVLVRETTEAVVAPPLTVQVILQTPTPLQRHYTSITLVCVCVWILMQLCKAEQHQSHQRMW